MNKPFPNGNGLFAFMLISDKFIITVKAFKNKKDSIESYGSLN